MRKGGAENEASSGQHLVRRAGGCGRDIYSNNEAIKKGVQVNHPAAPARGSWAEHYRRNEEEQAEMAIFMDCIVATLEAMLWLYVILELLIRCMLGVG